MTSVHIYCDGACSGNPGPGGWAAYLSVPGKPEADKLICGHADATTNNRMELTAAIEGLKALKFPCQVEVFSDSQYLCYTLAKNWKRKANTELWAEIDKLATIHSITWTWLARNSTPQLVECDAKAKHRVHV
ncbi:RNase H family protein [Microcoleus sp. herbarium14]|uniref:RNase H family protein n=1 Tax=Microcoleus sp. herbarium14 TaxID=3055439 RepID=UPI002FD54B95